MSVVYVRFDTAKDFLHCLEKDLSHVMGAVGHLTFGWRRRPEEPCIEWHVHASCVVRLEEGIYEAWLLTHGTGVSLRDDDDQQQKKQKAVHDEIRDKMKELDLVVRGGVMLPPGRSS